MTNIIKTVWINDANIKANKIIESIALAKEIKCKEKKPIIVDNVIYESIGSFSRKNKIHKTTTQNRLRNLKFPNYQFYTKQICKV